MKTFKTLLLALTLIDITKMFDNMLHEMYNEVSKGLYNLR